VFARCCHASSEEKGFIMTSNVGTIDRIVRVVVGLALIAYAIPLGFSETGWNWIGWIGVVPLMTGLLGTCPLYSMVGLSTCSARA
jgi:hypothetical protein